MRHDVLGPFQTTAGGERYAQVCTFPLSGLVIVVPLKTIGQVLPALTEVHAYLGRHNRRLGVIFGDAAPVNYSAALLKWGDANGVDVRVARTEDKNANAQPESVNRCV